ncbi:hypothetical protein OAT67_01595 [Bacteriovoracaceae bacterium]|nr:hypothetical protein [Bacteriovoracaceae bacterium]
MGIRKYIDEINTQLFELSREEKTNLVLLSLNMLIVLLGYALLRSPVESLFIEYVGAKNSPKVWLLSILVLSLSISIFNTFQKKIEVKSLYVGTSFFFASGMFLFSYFVHRGNYQFAYPLYIFKEVYIVLLIHLTLGFLNASISEKLAKVVYGPFGAIGSIGGVIGGLFVGSFVKQLGTNAVMMVGVATLIISSYLFSRLIKTSFVKKEETTQDTSPIQSLKNVKSYIFLLICLVAVSQFVINLFSFKFNLVLESSFATSVDKAQFLGKIYSGVNTFSLLVQFLVIPFVFKRFSEGKILAGIPISFSIFIFGCLALGSPVILAGVTFAFLKGMDYSIFSASKELLYFVLDQKQKYGAKYIVDMVFYRASKGFISIFLIYFQTPILIDLMLVFCLILWIVLLIPLIKKYNKLHELKVRSII